MGEEEEMKDKNFEYVRGVLLDSAENTPLRLKNGDGAELNFEQVFAVEHEDALYCILRPLFRVEGLGTHVALAFTVDARGVFRAVKEKSVSDRIFGEYYSALRDVQKRG